jgi:hypothetical protein
LALAADVWRDWEGEEHEDSEEWHFAGEDQRRERSRDVMVGKVRSGLQGALADEDIDDKLRYVSTVKFSPTTRDSLQSGSG